MTATQPDVLACLRLVGGRSEIEVRELTAGKHDIELTVGSAPDCDWRVVESGVAPVHFTLRWDGMTLHVADTRGAGSVWVDGNVVGKDFQPLDSRARIEFGRAAMVTETWSSRSGTGSSRPHTAVPRHISSVGSTGEVPHARESQPRAGVKENTGTRLAHVSKHTIEGYAVKVTDDSELTRTLAGHLKGEKSPSSPPGTALVTRGPSRDAIRPAPREEMKPTGHHGADYDDDERIPHAVLVLSPRSTTSLPENISGFSTPPPRQASWRMVSLGVVAILGGYAGWVYLMANL